MKIVESGSNQLVIEIDSTLYTDSVVHKCFYWYGEKFSVDMERTEDGKRVLVVLGTPEGTSPVDDWHTVVDKIKRDLMDYATREIINDETRTIRELIIAKAFSSFDEPSPPTGGEVTDPVGFSVEDFVAGMELMKFR